MAISVNTLIQWQDEQGRWQDEHGGQLIERVLWINECASHVFVIDIDPDNHQAWPTLKACHDLEQALEAGTARRVREDPYSYLRQEDSAFNPDHLKRRNKAWSRIRSIVTAKHNGEIFNPHVLGPLVVKAEAKAARKAKKPLQIRKHLYIYLRHYWQGGQIKNALLPRYDRCGGKGKVRSCPEGAPKRGRRRSEKKAQESIGINVDETIEKQFLWATKRFYEKGHKSVSESYRQLCEHYYIRWDKENGKPKATLLKDRPSENQYRYWLS
ncbi:MAG TPA: hypothetical protein VH593_01020 [Ktedonobacteraceae bacterium]|jgi:hypothetical protein